MLDSSQGPVHSEDSPSSTAFTERGFACFRLDISVMFYFSCLFDSVPRFGLTMQDPFRPSDLLLHSAGPSACCNAAARVCECGAALVHTGVEAPGSSTLFRPLNNTHNLWSNRETTSRVSPLSTAPQSRALWLAQRCPCPSASPAAPVSRGV